MATSSTDSTPTFSHSTDVQTSADPTSIENTQPAAEMEAESETFFFESDHVALKGNKMRKDFTCVLFVTFFALKLSQTGLTVHRN